jgi:hypothetical protein
MTSEPLTVPTTPFEYQPRPPSFTTRRIIGAVALGNVCAVLAMLLMAAVMLTSTPDLAGFLSRADLPLQQLFGPAFSFEGMAGLLCFLTGGVLSVVEVWMIGGWIRRRGLFLLASALTMLILIPIQVVIILQINRWDIVAVFIKSAISGNAGQIFWFFVIALLGGAAGLALGYVQSRWLSVRARTWMTVTALAWGISSWVITYLLAAFFASSLVI